jgi:hypothetical protein
MKFNMQKNINYFINDIISNKFDEENPPHYLFDIENPISIEQIIFIKNNINYTNNTVNNNNFHHNTNKIIKILFEKINNFIKKNDN